MRLVIIICMVFASLLGQTQDYKIGVITDFEKSIQVEAVINEMVFEIDHTSGASHKVSLAFTFYSIENMEEAKLMYSEKLRDVDLILSLGSISTKGLSSIDQLPIPVIGLGIIDPNIQEIPCQNGTSGKKNFTYIWQTNELEHELEAFSKIHAFKKVAVLVDEKSAMTINAEKARNRIDSIAQLSETEIRIIAFDESAENVLSQLESDVDAVYLTLLVNQSEQSIRTLIEALNQRKTPTFTGSSRFLDYGVLGSMTNENDLSQVIRNLAIKSDEIFSGADLAKIPVKLETKQQLYINVSAARILELSVPFDVLFTATLIGENNSSDKAYSFEEIISKSLETNLNIKISYQDVELSEIDIKSARATMLPALESSLTGSQINEELANAAFNNPERAISANLSITQVIYSEQAVAAIKISKYLQKAQEYNTQSEVLDVIFDTYIAYLNVLSAKTNVLVQTENLQNTRKNAELAQLRVDLGTSNNSDLFRWEAELAFANQAVIEAKTLLLSSKLQLRTLLANNLEVEYDIEDVSLQDDWFKAFATGPLAEITKSPKSLQIVSDFLVEESLRENPNKKFIEENINASNRQLKQNQRLQYIPTLALKAETSQILARGGAGSEIDQGSIALGVTEHQNNSWFAGFSVSYPIFTGFSRNAAIQQSKTTLEQLGNSKDLLNQNLELGVRATVLSLLSARTNIKFSNDASSSAQKNFELVQEYYKQGSVNITQLIDAQQAALETKLNAALSSYQYVQTHLQLEYNIGSFTMLMSEEELKGFTQRLLQYTSK